MENIKKIIVGFLAGVGIGGLIEAVISLIIGENIVGVPAFVASVGSGYAKIIQCLVYGGFGIVSFITSEIFKNKDRSVYINQTIHFLAILIYFIFAGLYLRWFAYDFTMVISLGFFVVIYFLIALGFYLYEKKMIEEINNKL
uniref:DUF3021 domain-containing protein n=1 Tax=Anaerococcus mediterraneensis TaxID=1870984 RepID=UPI0009304C14|nr:DUF3021 domain-containing protein [Anaerococcus mediterraneensis]